MTIDPQDVHRLRHDLRTPLAVIVGFADVLALKDEIDDGERREYAQHISTAANEIRELLEGFERLQA